MADSLIGAVGAQTFKSLGRFVQKEAGIKNVLPTKTGFQRMVHNSPLLQYLTKSSYQHLEFARISQDNVEGTIEPLPEQDTTSFEPEEVKTGDDKFDQAINETRTFASDGLNKLQTNFNETTTFLYKQISQVSYQADNNRRRVNQLVKRTSALEDRFEGYAKTTAQSHKDLADTFAKKEELEQGKGPEQPTSVLGKITEEVESAVKTYAEVKLIDKLLTSGALLRVLGRGILLGLAVEDIKIFADKIYPSLRSMFFGENPNHVTMQDFLHKKWRAGTLKYIPPTYDENGLPTMPPEQTPQERAHDEQLEKDAEERDKKRAEQEKADEATRQEERKKHLQERQERLKKKQQEVEDAYKRTDPKNADSDRWIQEQIEKRLNSGEFKNMAYEEDEEPSSLREAVLRKSKPTNIIADALKIYGQKTISIGTDLLEFDVNKVKLSDNALKAFQFALQDQGGNATEFDVGDTRKGGLIRQSVIPGQQYAMNALPGGGRELQYGIGAGIRPQQDIGTPGGYTSGGANQVLKYDNSHDLGSGKERFFHKQGNLHGVDPKLMTVLRDSSKDLPPGWRAEIISGHDARSTGTRNHPNGIAVDIQLYDDKGRAVPNNKGSWGFGAYEKYYQSSIERAHKWYPGEQMIWGGGFVSGVGNDKMHYQWHKNIPGTSQGMAAYDPNTGLKGQYRNSYDPSHEAFKNAGEIQEYRKSISGGISASPPSYGDVPDAAKPGNAPPTLKDAPANVGDMKTIYSAYDAKTRERLFAEMEKNPQLKDKLFRMARSENDVDPAGPMESAMNRALRSGKTMNEILTPRFYGPMRPGAKGEDNFNPALSQNDLNRSLLDYRRLEGGYTHLAYRDNQGEVGREDTGGVTIAGETYSYFPGSQRWAIGQMKAREEYNSRYKPVEEAKPAVDFDMDLAAGPALMRKAVADEKKSEAPTQSLTPPSNIAQHQIDPLTDDATRYPGLRKPQHHPEAEHPSPGRDGYGNKQSGGSDCSWICAI